MLFSIIIPVFNKEETVRETIESILSQDFEDFEIIVVDDGSKDSSQSIVRSIADTRLKYFYMDNSGPSAARNHGLQLSTGEWIMFMDADDIMSEGTLSLFFRNLKEHSGVNMIVGDYVEIEGDVIRNGKGFGHSGCISSPFKAWFFSLLHPRAGTYICRRSLLGCKPYNEQFRCYEDVDMLFNIFRKAKIYKFDSIVMKYMRTYSTESKRRHPVETNFICNIKFSPGKSLWEQICLYEKYIEAKNIYPEQYRKLYPNISKHFMIMFLYHLAFRLRSLKK